MSSGGPLKTKWPEVLYNQWFKKNTLVTFSSIAHFYLVQTQKISFANKSYIHRKLFDVQEKHIKDTLET